MCIFESNYVHLTPHAFLQILWSYFIERKLDWQMRMVVCVFWISALKWLCWSHCYHDCWSDWLFKTHCLQPHAMSHPHNTHTMHIHIWSHDTHTHTHTLSLFQPHTHWVSPHPWSWGDGRSDGDRASEEGWRDGPPGSWRGVGGILQVAVENKSILYWALCSHKERKWAKWALKCASECVGSCTYP